MPQARIVIESTDAMMEISSKSPAWQPHETMDAIRENMRQVAAQMHAERQIARTPAAGQNLSQDGAERMQLAQDFFSGTMQGVQSIESIASESLRFLGQGSDSSASAAPVHAVRSTVRSAPPRPVRSSAPAPAQAMPEGMQGGLTAAQSRAATAGFRHGMRFIPGEVQIRMVRYPELKISVEYGGYSEQGQVLNEAT